jgi:hypothetical protein
MKKGPKGLEDQFSELTKSAYDDAEEERQESVSM